MNRLIEARAEAAGAFIGAVQRIDYTWNEAHSTSERTYSTPEMSEDHSTRFNRICSSALYLLLWRFRSLIKG